MCGHPPPPYLRRHLTPDRPHNHNILNPQHSNPSIPSLPTKRHGAPLLIVDSSRLLAISLPTLHISHSLRTLTDTASAHRTNKSRRRQNSDRFCQISIWIPVPRSKQPSTQHPATAAYRGTDQHLHNSIGTAYQHCIASALSPTSTGITASHTYCSGQYRRHGPEDRAATQYTKHLSWLSIAAQTVHLF